MPTYSSLENIFKRIISQNPENLDLPEGVCMYCLTDWVSGFAGGDRVDRELGSLRLALAWKLVVSISWFYVTLLGSFV